MKNLLRSELPSISKDKKEEWIQKSLELILKLSEPLKVLLVGSGSREDFDAASDLDFVLIFKDLDAVKINQSILYRSTPQFPTAVDFICTDESTYNAKSKIGGIFFIAAEDGRLLFSRA